MDMKQFASVVGFAFVAAIIAFNFGYALLCLLGAGAGYAVASYLEGSLDVGELQSRFNARDRSPSAPPPPPPPRAAGSRVR